MKKGAFSGKKRILILVLAAACLLAGLIFVWHVTRESGPPPTTQLPVLAYHRILSMDLYYPNHVDNGWVLSDEVFEEQMRYLYDSGFQTITAAQLAGFLHRGEDLPPNAILITFDDGYLDNAVFAYPIMRQFGFTGIVYVITSVVPEEQIPLLSCAIQYMSFADMEETLGAFEFGSHTHDMHHSVDGEPRLVREGVEEIRADLRKSFAHDLIRLEAGFAYPYGRHSENAVAALEAEGVAFALTTAWGYVERDTNPFRLPRFSIASDFTPELFSRVVRGEWAPE